MARKVSAESGRAYVKVDQHYDVQSFAFYAAGSSTISGIDYWQRCTRHFQERKDNDDLSSFPLATKHVLWELTFSLCSGGTDLLRIWLTCFSRRLRNLRGNSFMVNGCRVPAASRAKRRQRRWPLIDQRVSVKSEAEPRSYLARQKLEYKAHGSLRGRNRKDTNK